MYLNNGELNGKRLLSRKTIESIMANQIGDLLGGAKSDQNYNLAFGVVTAAGAAKGGQASEGTFTWGGYFNTNYWADPKEKIVVVLMKQTRGLSNDDSEAVFTRMVYQTIDD